MFLEKILIRAFKNRTELEFLVLVFLISFLVRWLKISQYLFFGFEQGRDAQIVEGIIKSGDYVLAGPSTSIGGIFHGPWYFYLISIPYELSSGNPLAASFLLSILGSLIPVVIYFLGKDLFKSSFWGICAALMTTFSYEYILYSRWLSNVSPAPLFIALSFLALWKFLSTKSQTAFLAFVVFSSMASLFEIILLPQYLFLGVILLLFKQVPRLSLKTILISLAVSLFLFSPLIIFDFRNEHIIFNSIISLGIKSSSFDKTSVVDNLAIYIKQLYEHFALSVFYIRFLPVQIFIVLVTVFGLVLSIWKKTDQKALLFLAIWLLSTTPVIKISPGDPQHYVGVGLIGILLFCLSLKNICQVKNLKIFALIFIPLFMVSVYFTTHDLVKNKNIFFRTTQDDLVYSDQKALLGFIHQDASGQPYKLVSYTVPFLHPEGWEYLHKYFYPNQTSENARIIYVTIETGVYPQWEEKWTSELGATRLELEKKFGLIRLQKRILE